jgi:Ni/Co efflux regulator RcnB
MRLIATSLAAGLIAFTAVSPAFADQRGRGHGRGHDRGHDRDWNDRDYRDGYRDARRDDRRHDRRHDDRRDRRGWYDSRGSHHHWSRGDYFSYRPHYSSYVVVHDYNRYRLPPPRHGQHYYRDSNTGEILLIAAATGLVLWALTQ